jgi:hypothetical protein
VQTEILMVCSAAVSPDSGHTSVRVCVCCVREWRTGVGDPGGLNGAVYGDDRLVIILYVRTMLSVSSCPSAVRQLYGDVCVYDRHARGRFWVPVE